MSTDLPGHPPDDLPDEALGIRGDLPGDIASSEPGLGALLGILTAGATPDELTGESAALAMFRANRLPAVPAPGPAFGDVGTHEFEPHEFEPRAFEPLAFGPPAAEPRLMQPPTASGRRGAARIAPGRRDSRRQPRRVGLMAAAVTLAAAAGFAVAAYTEALPAPLQQAAYHVLGFAGVPSAHQAAPSVASSSAPGHARGHGSSHKPGRSRSAASASPRPGGSSPPSLIGHARLSITVASGRIVAGRDDRFTGRLTDKAGGVAGANLSLLEREAGQRAWTVAGTATTGSNGDAVITATDLTVNAAFRLKGPDGTLSRPVLVIVTPPVSVTVGATTGTVTASSPLAAPGNTVVLQVLSGTHWLTLQMGRLNGAGQAQFAVRSRAMQRTYRVVLLPTASHGLSVSNAVTIPPR